MNIKSSWLYAIGASALAAGGVLVAIALARTPTVGRSGESNAGSLAEAQSASSAASDSSKSVLSAAALASSAASPKPLDRYTTQAAILGANFGDSRDVMHPGGRKFLAWSILNLAYEDVFDSDLQRTSFDVAMRDMDLERNRRMCVNGLVLEIQGTNALGARVYAGSLIDDGGGRVLIAAVADAERVYAGTRARFCGVVVGRESFLTNDGQRLVGPRLIGMFDTDDNRRRTRASLRVERLAE